MGSNSSMPTSITLLGRLRNDPADQEAWSHFVHRYGPQVYRWCRRWQLQESDAQDVTQAVLTRLAAKMRSFTYDPAQSFRGYLRTLTRYAWCDFLEANKQPGAGSGDSEVLKLLNTVAAGDDLVQRLNEQFDQELLAEAQSRVRQRVEQHTWEAFRLTALEGLSGADTAAQLDMKVAAVFKARSRVQKMLHDEIARLEHSSCNDSVSPGSRKSCLQLSDSRANG
jgi:RNA polymerase sigma-70 factor (ECF subfamily)